MKKHNPMIVMMKLFFKSFVKYGRTLKRQNRWLNRFVSRFPYSINKNLMFNINLKLWLSEAEDVFGKRICPCFCPTGNPELDKKMICPCKFLEDDIRQKGTCHCTLFAAKDSDKNVYKKAMGRLMKEYQTPMLLNEDGEIDIRKYPVDEKRGLRVPDAYHLAKRAVIMTRDNVKMFVEHKYEIDALTLWGQKNGYIVKSEAKQDGYSVSVAKIN